MGLFKPAWMSKNREKAKKALEKITDYKLLMEITLNEDVDEDVYVSAWNRLCKQIERGEISQSALVSIAKDKEYAKRIDERNPGHGIAVRITAVEMLNCRDTLYEIVETDGDPGVVLAAIEALQGGPYCYERYTDDAAHNMLLKERLVNFAKSNKSYIVDKLIFKLYTLDLLGENDLLSDNAMLFNVAMAHGRQHIVMELITDQTKLADVIKNAKDIEISHSACMRLFELNKELGAQLSEIVVDRIIELIKTKSSSSVYAEVTQLTKIAELAPDVIKKHWSKIANLASSMHYSHTDYSWTRSSDCGSTEHEDLGFSMKRLDGFPPYVKE